MTAQEWLNELSRLSDAATPGPWVCKEGEGVDEDDLCITAEEREGMIDIAKIERGSPNAGMDEPFQSEQTANAAYIVTACNAVPKLVEMVMWMAEKLEEEAMPQECEYNGKTMVASLSLEDWLNQVYEVTEPKE